LVAKQGLPRGRHKKSAPSESRPREWLIPRLPTCYPELAPLTLRTSGTIDLARSDAGRYVYAGREWVVERVRRIVGGTVTDSIHHHNYAWRERHGDRDLWVVPKGATPAFPGQRGFIGGSMGDDAVIIEGVDSEASRASLYSTIHGAGRLFGRMRRSVGSRGPRWMLGCRSAK
jgi:tRNA-splicing ligase RtcB